MTTQHKAVTIQDSAGGKILEIRVSGKLTQDDYAEFVPRLEELIKQHGKLRLLVYLTDFHGWSASALWEDTLFDWNHFRDIERLAIVGESKWQHGMAVFCKPFTMAEIRYFEHNQLPDARQWMESE